MHKQERRHAGTLEPRHHRLVDLVLGTGDFDEATLISAGRFYNRLTGDVNRFLAGRTDGQRGRITKRDATVMLGIALAKLAKDGAE